MSANRGNIGWTLRNMIDHERLIAGVAGNLGPSPEIWTDCPLLAIMCNPGVGFYYFDDFMGPSINIGADATAEAGGWTCTFLASVADAQMGVGAIGVGGEIVFAELDGTKDQSINAQLLNCCVKPTALKDIWFECRLQVSAIDEQLFIGVASTDTTIIPAGVLDETTPSLIGFFVDENSATSKGGTISQKAGSTDVSEDDIDMAATTWYTLGFKVDGVGRIKFYQNGVLKHTVEDTDDIPDAVELALSVFLGNESGGSANSVTIDWIRIAQLR